MQITDEAIQRFFKHECEPQEARMVSEYLKSNPHIAEAYLPKKEWDETADIYSMPEEFWQMQWQKIRPVAAQNRVITMVKRLAVAAIFILAIGAAVYYLYPKKSQQNIAVVEKTTDKNIHNASKELMAVNLPDGSVVELSPGAAINYKEPFEENARNISLKGEAIFSVAKDASRPFTVTSGNITTTALGTKFKVVYLGNDKKTVVHLYEGKVVVKTVSSVNKKESYLMPGDVLSYINETFTIEKTSGSNAAAKVIQQNKNTIAPSLETTAEAAGNNKKMNAARPQPVAVPQWYKFEKETLANVFDQLADLYKVEISYNKDEIRNIYFIGKFEQTSSIENILKTIANVNQLQIEKVDEKHYVVKK